MPIAWPTTLEPQEMTWGMTYNNRAFTSTLSNAQQIVGFPGAYWQCSLSFDGLNARRERQLTALLGRLQGQFGTVNLPAFTRRRTDDIGDVVVTTANAQATTMLLRGATPSVLAFQAGDYLTVAGVLYEVTDDATTGADGTVLVNLNRRIRQTVPGGTPVEYRNPYAEMRLTTDAYSLTRRPRVASGSIELREAF